MTRSKLFRAALALATLAAAAPVAMQAQAHPEYTKSLSDLRAAREYLRPGPDLGPYKVQDEQVLKQIDLAINDLKIAAAANGMSTSPVSTDSHMMAKDRFAKGRDLLDAALHDLDHAEDLPQARGTRDRARGHIQQAHQTVVDTMRTAHWQ